MRLQNFMRTFASVGLVALASTHVASEPSLKSADVVPVKAAPRASQIQPMVAPVKRTAPQVVSPPAQAASNKKTAAKPAVPSTLVQPSPGNSKKPSIKTASKSPAKKTH